MWKALIARDQIYRFQTRRCHLLPSIRPMQTFGRTPRATDRTSATTQGERETQTHILVCVCVCVGGGPIC